MSPLNELTLPTVILSRQTCEEWHQPLTRLSPCGPPAAMSSPPTTLGKYQIIREIARSNDIVYEAYDPIMDRRVALKELNMPSGATDQQRQDRIERFERECRAGGRLAHPNIMTIYEFGQDGSRYFMAMEYLDGNTLRHEIDTNGALPQERAIDIALAILKGLQHAHDNGVVHRDIKPDNIQLTTSGVKITDFGIARLTFQPNLTMDGQVFGTPSYMSPEQVRGGDIDARSDVFSVGILLHEMITGQKPFTGDSVITITYAILNHAASPASQASYSVQRVIEQALEKSAALRFSSAQEMAEALQRAENEAASGSFGPPMANPYMTPVPGSAIPTLSSPYGGTTTSAPAPPPVYPYNPYQPGPHQTGPVPPAGFPHPLPNYYPPPPRKPLLSPDQEALLKRIGVITVVLATFFAVVILSIFYFTGALTPKPASGAPSVMPSGVPIPAALPESQQDSGIAATQREQGLDLMARASTAPEPLAREALWESAAGLLNSAASGEPDGRLVRSDKERAALCYRYIYESQWERGIRGSGLREWIFRAAAVAPNGTEVAGWAEQAKAQIR